MSTTEPSTTTANGTLPLAPGRWVVDHAHSSVVFSIRHLGLSKVRGRFASFDATLDVGDTVDDVRVDATIDMSSVDTNNADRDAHLLSTDFFGVDEHPTMTFRSTGISGSAGDWILEGELTINGITKLVELEVEFHGTEMFQDVALHAGFSAEGELRRNDFGIDFGIIPLGGEKLALSDKVRWELDLQFVAPS
jgi:polyisoprenoid-binding protein YceI